MIGSSGSTRLRKRLALGPMGPMAFSIDAAKSSLQRQMWLIASCANHVFSCISR